MSKWLKKLFPGMRQEWHPVAVVRLPEWTERDAATLREFLATPAGQKLVDRMRYTVTAMCMSTTDNSAETRATRRSLALVMEGMSSMADWDNYRRRTGAGVDDEDDNTFRAE